MDQLESYFSPAIPSSLDFSPQKIGPEFSRRSNVYRPTSESSYSSSGNNVIYFHLPPEKLFVEPSSARLHFTLSGIAELNPTKQDFFTFANLFSRVRLTTMKGSIIEDIQFSDKLHGALNPFSLDLYYLNTEGSAKGESIAIHNLVNEGNIDKPDASDTDSFSSYTYSNISNATSLSMPMTNLSGFFKQGKLLPMWLLGGLMVEITLSNHVEAFVFANGSSGNPFTLSNVKMACEQLTLSEDFQDQFEGLVKAQGLSIPFSSWMNYQKRCLGSSETISVETRLKNIKTLFYTCFLDASAQAKNNRGKRNGLETYQFKVGSHFLNTQPIEVGPESYCEMVKALHGNSYGYVSLTSYTDKSGPKTESNADSIDSNQIFCIGRDCELSSDVRRGLYQAYKDQVPIELQITASGGSSRRCFLFVHYDAVLQLLPNGQQKVVY